MNKPTSEGLMRRLECVERENRRLKLVMSVLAAMVLIAQAVLAAGVLRAQATPEKAAKVIRAERFVLRDAAGKVRGELSVLPGGQAGLFLHDQNGKPRKLRAVLSVLPDGSPGLALLDKDGMVLWKVP